jgi:hypothetical protein
LFTLVIFNLGYLVWQTWYKSPLPVIVEAASGRIDPQHEIVLLNEASSSELVELQELVNQPGVQAVADTGQDRCAAIGPFASIFEGQDVGKQLEALGLSLTPRAVDESSGKYDYRLLIPPLNSLEQAFRKLRELQASDIDSYVITAGPSELGISMGVFSTEGAAITAQNKVKTAGFDGEIVQIARTNRSYWLFAEAGSNLEISEKVWENLKSANNSLIRKEFSCE